MQQEPQHVVGMHYPFHPHDLVNSFGGGAYRRSRDWPAGPPALNTAPTIPLLQHTFNSQNPLLHEPPSIDLASTDSLDISLDCSRAQATAAPANCPSFADTNSAFGNGQYSTSAPHLFSDDLGCPSPAQYYLSPCGLGVSTMASSLDVKHEPRSRTPASLAMEFPSSSALNRSDPATRGSHTHEYDERQLHGRYGESSSAAYASEYHNPRLDSRNKMPFRKPHGVKEISLICDGRPVAPHIYATIEKNVFFNDDKTWTCYRRNYISVACHFTLDPMVPGAKISVKSSNKDKCGQVQAFAVSLAANQDHLGGREIELIQHTAKRDRGPQNAIRKEKVSPSLPGHQPAPFAHPASTSAPHLPLQCDDEDRISQAHHTFERVQFKSATQNNGRRRAAQQFYHLVAELYADVRKSSNGPPNWVKIATNTSEQMVVRGRSPGHYTEKGTSDTSPIHHSSSSAVGGPAHYGFSGSTDGSSSVANTFPYHGSATTRAGAMYGSHHQFETSPTHTGQNSSSSSVSGGAVEYSELPLPDHDLFSPHKRRDYVSFSQQPTERGVMRTEDLNNPSWIYDAERNSSYQGGNFAKLAFNNGSYQDCRINDPGMRPEF